MCDGFFAYPVPDEVVTEGRWDLVRPLDANDPFIAGQVERAKRIVEGVNGECCVFYNVFCPLSSLRFAFEERGRSYDDLTDALKRDPLPVMRALDAIALTNALLCERLVEEAGVDGVYYCVQGGEATRFTPEQYRKLVRPSDLYVLEHANRYSDNNILHMCGWAGATNQLELWRDYPVRAVNWAVFVEGLSLIEGREFFGGKTVMGGFETHWDGTTRRGIIYTGTHDEIRNYTRSLILDHGKRGLILGGDCTVDAAIDWNHIRWVLEAAREL
nr:uroporphyrinogen decarboxylase family protein [Bifidobacterium miconis]